MSETLLICQVWNLSFLLHKRLCRPETYPKSFAFKPTDPPPKKAFFAGGSVPSDIFFSILEIRPWFKIWKTLKVSFWSIWNISVNTWSTPEDFNANEIWRYPKMTKKCIFSETKIFPTLLNQNLDVFSMDNVFSNVSEVGEESFWSANEFF